MDAESAGSSNGSSSNQQPEGISNILIRVIVQIL